MRIAIVILSTALAVAPAKAEFVMTPPTDGPQATAGPTDPVPPINRRPRPHFRLHRLAPSLPASAGFGDRVPLSFAVRQIVPPQFKVAYGGAVDTRAVVDWKGGKPWDATLADALRPLGLTASVSSGAVMIDAAAAAR
jgi:hypothetical protein